MIMINGKHSDKPDAQSEDFSVMIGRFLFGNQQEGPGRPPGHFSGRCSLDGL